MIMEFDVISAIEVKAGDHVKSNGDFVEVERVQRYTSPLGQRIVAIYFADTSRMTVRATDLVTRMRKAL